MQNKMKWFVVLAVMVAGFVGTAQAQMKLGYIDSEKILSEYKPYLDAQKEFQRYEEELEREVSKRRNDLIKMQETFERQALLLSEKRKQEEQQAIMQKIHSVGVWLKKHKSCRSRLFARSTRLLHK
jgi:outer membrane protein